MSTRTVSMRSPSARRRKSAAQARPLRRAPADTAAGPGVVDLTRVVEARRRIASGWYDREDVRMSLVEAVLEEMRSH
jgi:hypothetical protein